MYYFGCPVVPGHYLYATTGAKIYKHKLPWKYCSLDSTLCPTDPKQPEGLAWLHHKDGWTAISFWDRSGDSRRNSNSAFLTEGTYTFTEMLDISKIQFPDIWARFTFEVRHDSNQGT